MEKQKEQLQKLLEQLGYEAAVAEEMTTGFMSPVDGTEPELPIDNILKQVQEYAKPLLRNSLKREFSYEFKGQYMGEAINKIVAASKGKIRRANYEDGNVERALQDLVGILEQASTSSSESEDTINELKQQLEALTLDKEQSLELLRGEFAEKENARSVYDSLLSKLSAMQDAGAGKVSKRLSVDQQHAAKAILRELGEEYVLRYDEELKEVVLYDKAAPTERASDGQKLLSMNELIERSLLRNNWIAQSNGGSVDPRQFLNRPNYGPEKQVTESSEFRKALEAQVGGN